MDITDHISYVRVSTGPQEESKEVQKEYIDQYLNSRGLSCSICYSETTSAYKGKQEALDRAINENQNAYIHIKRIDRFSRNLECAMERIRRAKERNIYFNFIDEQLTTKNEHNMHYIRMKILESQNESEVIGRRIKDSIKVKKSKGGKIGKPTFGKEVVFKKGLRLFSTSKIERRIIDFIIQAREGTSSELLNNKLKKINRDADKINFYDSDGSIIEHFSSPETLRFTEIADLLNQYGIKNRKKIWTGQSVSRVYANEVKDTKKLFDSINTSLKIN